MKKELSIILPVFNEKDSLPIMVRLLNSTIKFKKEIIIVYDDQNDNSVEVAKELAAELPDITLVHNNIGKGAKYAVEMGVRISKYENIKEDLTKMKKMYSSGALTALQKSAEVKQKWPLLNLVRQILKSNNYNMEPIRKSNGYTKEGKKKYLRFFIIKKIKSTKEVEVEVN